MNLRNVLITYYLWRKNKIRNICKRAAKKRRFWVRPMFLLRNELGAGKRLLMEMRLNPDNGHYNFLRMSVTTFDKLLSLVGPRIKKPDLGREPIDIQKRLAITLRFLASGDSIRSLSYLFRVGLSTICTIISETLAVVWSVLQPLVLEPPIEERWKQIEDGFRRRWNYPNCIGAIDGKHVDIQAPPQAGSSFYNYKGSHSVVLMAVVDHDYCFTLVDIWAQGRQSDGGIFRNSLIEKKIIDNTLSIPAPKIISDGRPPLPYVIVGDEAFPLLENLMRPYPGKTDDDLEKRIYNYRHSRARRISENAFGILTSQWRIFSKNIIGKLENVDNIIKACICLHNYVIKYDKNSSYIPDSLVDIEDADNFAPGTGRNVQSRLPAIEETDVNVQGSSANEIRDILKEYFNEEGAVPWQWDSI